MGEIEDLLQPYGAAPDDIRRAADQLSARAIDVENLNAGVDGVHARARGAVEGLLEGPLANAPVRVRLGAYAVMQRTLFGAAAVTLFARYVNGYNAEIANLLEEWQDAVDNDFGTRLEDPAEHASELAAQAAFDDALAAVRQDKEASLRLRQQALEAELEHGADTVKWVLAAGITDESMRYLWDSAAMPLGAVAAFPGSDFLSGVNPVARWWNLVYTDVVPAGWLNGPDSRDMRLDRIYDFLLTHSHMVTEFSLLLGMEGIAEPELLYLEALGRLDSERVNSAIERADFDSDRASLDRIAEGVGRLREINFRIAAGEHVTPGERAYWQGWFDNIDADVLTALPGHVDELIHTPEMMSGVPQADEDQYVQRLRQSYLGPIADSIMNMSDPAVVHGPSSNSVIHLDEMPEVIERLATTEIGSTSSAEDRTFIPEEGRLWGVTIPGVEEFAGFADLMATSTAVGGEQFTVELGEHAIRVQRQVDEVAGSYVPTVDAFKNALLDRWHAELGDDAERARSDRWITEHLWGDVYGPSSDTVADAIDELDALLNQGSGAASTMLSVVARNPTASASLVLDADLPSLLGANWRDDTGATAVIMAGTDRDPTSGGGTPQQADAARALFLEVGSNPPVQMSEGVANATVDVGIEWIDTFTHDPATPGHEELGVSLPSAARRDYLAFVAGTGTTDIDDPGTRFGYAVQLNSVDWITDALRTGDASQVDNALERAATLDGSFVRAVYEQSMDEELDYLRAAQTSSVSKQQQMAMLGSVAAGDSSRDSDIWAVWLDTEGSPIDPELVSATLPTTVPGADLPRVGASEPIPEVYGDVYVRTFTEHTHAAAGSRDYMLLLAAHAAEADATQVGSTAGVPQLPPYSEVREQVLSEGDGSLLREVATAVQRTYGNDLALDQYDEAWEQASRTRYDEMLEDARDTGD